MIESPQRPFGVRASARATSLLSSLPLSWLNGIDSRIVASALETGTTLRQFIGGPLIAAIGNLSVDQVLGPWEGRRPAAQRRRATFIPALYSDNHSHDHVELCHLIEGRCLFSFGRESSLLEAGDIVLLPGGMVHAEAFLRRSVGYQLAWWCLHESDPNLHVTKYTRHGGFSLEHGVGLDALPSEAHVRIEALRRMAASPHPPSIDRLREALLTISLHLYRRALTVGDERMDRRKQLVRRAMEYVREHTDQPLTLSEVAKFVHVSPNYLTSMFRSQSGVPLGRFIIEERVALAQVLLRQHGNSVKAVASELGFADQFAFSKAFKRVTGFAPREWQLLQSTG